VKTVFEALTDGSLESLLSEHLLAAPAVTVYRPHPKIVLVRQGSMTVVLSDQEVWAHERTLFRAFAEPLAAGLCSLVLVGNRAEENIERLIERGVFFVCPRATPIANLGLLVRRALELLASHVSAESHGAKIERYQVEQDELLEIARAMSTERNVDQLLGIILQKCRFVTRADAGSIYVVEPDQKGAQRLRFKLTQNDSLQFDSREFTMPISNRSLAGSVVLSKRSLNITDVYDLEPGSTLSFDRSFDDRVGYRTKSVLTVPLISQRDEVIGVLQLINCKSTRDAIIRSESDVQEHVVAFDQRNENILRMIAAQAGISLENALLYGEIQALFEGFVRACVEAIEARDPTTSGHSRRVADFTVELARVVNDVSDGPHRNTVLSEDSLRELEYASLLHDFGKIGVRERVLVKAKKLYDDRLEVLRARFDDMERAAELNMLRRKLHAVEQGAGSRDMEELDLEFKTRKEFLESTFHAILNSNEPSIVDAGEFERIQQIAAETYVDLRGNTRTLLDEEDVIALSVKRGSLTPNEYAEISSHVTHTYNFLARIPWGKRLQHVPKIAGAHHERLNGTGYPNRLRGDEIPVQAKMMSISDIYDALTASDRPYKKALSTDRALEILDFNVKDGHLDSDLVRIFRESQVWVRVQERKKP
jgi:HD-GYP domain-containing protein (c-di-GMP phosphodiesterase class II)